MQKLLIKLTKELTAVLALATPITSEILGDNQGVNYNQRFLQPALSQDISWIAPFDAVSRASLMNVKIVLFSVVHRLKALDSIHLCCIFSASDDAERRESVN